MILLYLFILVGFPYVMYQLRENLKVSSVERTISLNKQFQAEVPKQ
jgi:hypothetical protein